MEKVSVIIPTHYRPDRLDLAIKSVLDQTYKELEIIIISDGIDNETANVVHRYQEIDARIMFYEYNPSRGGNYARNLGIKNSNGKYIAFLDDDDIWKEHKIERQIELLQCNSRVGLVNCGINNVFPEKKLQYTSKMSVDGNISKTILFGNSIGSTSAVMVRREALETCGVFDEKLTARQDYDLWLRICQKYEVKTVGSIELDYYNYEQKGNHNQISYNLEKLEKSYELIFDKYKDLYTTLSKNEVKLLYSNRYLALAQVALKASDKNNVKRYGWIAWNYRKSIKALYFMFFYWVPYSFLVRMKSKKKMSA